MSDNYIRQAVKLENLKEGEARAIVTLLDNVQGDLLSKLPRAGTDWSRERYTAMVQAYGDALDATFNKRIIPELDAGGLEFTSKNLTVERQLLYEEATRSTFSQQLDAAKASGFDIDRPVYRGAENLQKLEAGQYFALDPKYVETYTGVDAQFPTFGSLRPVSGKFYVPKAGQIDFRDAGLQKAYGEWYAKDYLKKFPTTTYSVDDLKAEASYHFRQGLKDPASNGLPFYKHLENDAPIKRFLDAEKPGWTSTLLYEGDAADGVSNISVYTNGPDIAKSVYSDFVGNAPAGTTVKMGGSIITANLGAEALYTAAVAQPMQGRIMAEWATQLVRKDKQLISSALRTAWLEGEGIVKASARLAPILASTRNGLKAITRTFYGHLASETRARVFEENADIIEGQEWDSTLDARTTVEICAPRDGLLYTLKGEPVGHSLPFLGGPGQAHWSCRSFANPVIKGQKKEVKRQAVGPGKQYKEGDNLTKTGKVRKNTAANRKAGKLKETAVSPNKTYSQWLKDQGKTPEGRLFQNDILGEQRAEAFRNGEWKLGEKFTATKPITVKGFGGVVPPVTVPPVVTTKLAPVSFGKHAAGKWSTSSFSAAPRPLQEVVAKTVDGVQELRITNKGKKAYYTASDHRVNMGSKKKIGNKEHEALFRHEVGHAVDAKLGHSHTTQLPDHLKNLGTTPSLDGLTPTRGVLHKKYRSGFSDFTDAVETDSFALRNSTNAIKYGYTAQTSPYTAVKTNLADIDVFTERVSYVKDMAAKVGIDYDELKRLARNESYLFDDPFDTATGYIGTHTRFAQLIKAIELKDPEKFYDTLTGRGDYSLPGSQRGYKESGLYFADLIGATTKNMVMPYSPYPGHTSNYYNNWSGAAPTEVFANLTCLYGNENTTWVALIKKFVPTIARKYEEIIGL